MKEIMALIRVNMVNQTKDALARAGYPAFTCRKCLGRGKKGIDSMALQTIIEHGELPANALGEHLTESHRLIAKRYFTLVVEDDQVEHAVQTIVDANQTGNPGDGRIFISPITESYTIRTFETAGKAN